MKILVSPGPTRGTRQSWHTQRSHFLNRRIHSSSSSESHSHNGLKNGTSKKERLEEQRKKEEMKAEEERLT